jgi:hypothetical protein
MVDSIDPKKLKETSEALTDTTEKTGFLQAGFESLIGIFSNVDKALESTNDSINKNRQLTENQSQAISLLSANVLGARQAFQGFAFEGVGSFKESFTVIESEINKITSEGEGGFGKLLKFAKEKIGINLDPSQFTTIQALSSHIKSVGKTMMEHADNAIKLERSYLSLGAKSGELGEIFTRSGDGFKNLNAVMSEQRAMIDSVAAATNHSIGEVEKYYMEIGKLPGGLKETVTGLDGTARGMTMLQGAINVARGTGQDFTGVVTDLNSAFTNYGLTGEKALTFTARISELSSNLKIRMEDVRAGILATAQAFKGLADTGEAANRMAEGAAKIFNQYVGALKETGLTGQDAISILTNMETQVKNLTLAQKGFLSAQTGGAGGLRGAFQIEQMMREGDIEGVMDKVRKQMEGQLGKIVTVQEAASSEAAAAQLTRQIMILKQGPLGGMAKTDQDAMRLLEGLKGMQEGKGAPAELKEGILKDTMNKGNDIQMQSFGELQKMRILMEQAQSSRDLPSLGMMQRTGTAAAGFETADTEAQEQQRRSLTDFSKRYSEFATDINKLQLSTKPAESVTGQQQFKLYEDFKDVPKSVLNFGAAMADTVKGIFGFTKPAISEERQREELNRDLARAGRDRTLQQETREAVRVTAAPAATAAKPATATQQDQRTKPVESKVDLKVTAICMHCKNSLETSHSRVVNTGNQ